MSSKPKDTAFANPASQHMQGSVQVARPIPSERHATLFIIFFACYALAAVYFFLAYAEPYLAAMDLYAPRMLADSIAYQTICRNGEYYFDWTTVRDIGPCIGLTVTSYNMLLVSIFNSTLIVFMVSWVARSYDRPSKILIFLALINPLTFLSLFGPNKEIFGAASVLGLIVFVKDRSFISLVVSLITALFSRIPGFITMLGFCIMMVIFLPRDQFLSAIHIRRYRFITMAMVVAISLIVLFAGAELQYSMLGDVAAAEDISQATAMSLSFEGISASGLYVVTYIARLVLNLYSGVVGISTFGLGSIGIYYGIGIAGSSLLFTIMTVVSFVKKTPHDMFRSAVSYNLKLFAIFSTMILCISPVIQHRYFYPLYFIMLLFVTRPRGGELSAVSEKSSGAIATPVPSQ